MANNNLFDDDNENGLEDLYDNSGVWVFGYGSLCWQPGFDYHQCVTGYIRGYSRKFWQGTTNHRGTKERPGRVATLVEDSEGVVWGRAYEIRGEAALPYLDTRECQLGGYLTKWATFYPRENDVGSSNVEPFPVLIYIAAPDNDQWLGDAPLTEIASQIAESSGTSGHNVEYLIKLAVFMRKTIPEAYDEHLFTLEHLVRTKIKEKNMNLDSLLQNQNTTVSEQTRANVTESRDLVGTFQFAENVPEKKLRCLKV